MHSYSNLYQCVVNADSYRSFHILLAALADYPGPSYCSYKNVMTPPNSWTYHDWGWVRWLRCSGNLYDRTRQIVTLNARTDENVSVGIVAAKGTDEITALAGFVAAETTAKEI